MKLTFEQVQDILADHENRLNEMDGLITYSDQLEKSWRFRHLFNEVTYLHNEVNEIKKFLGMDGTEPTVKPKPKSNYD